MTKFWAIQSYLKDCGTHYIKPEKAGDLKDEMIAIREKGQAARLAFSHLMHDFQREHTNFFLNRVSNWASQAQICRPHFWVYLRQDEELTDPMFAFRLYGHAQDFGISAEVSIIERKKDQASLQKQNSLLQAPAIFGSYYQYNSDGFVVKTHATEENRLELLAAVETGKIRKVLAKIDIPWMSDLEETELLYQMGSSLETLRPYYIATRLDRK